MAPINNQNPDLRRLQEEYLRRAAEQKTHDLYSPGNPAHNWMISDRRKNILDGLSKFGFGNLDDLRIMELGCGSGGVIKEFIQYGASPHRLFGVDLLLDRLEHATGEIKKSNWINANGQCLPFQDECFDLLLQFTAFSSILDPEIKKDMAVEMMRVLKPGSYILWYDFVWNPTNQQTRGINLKEIERLFSGCDIFPSRITLAPPLTRILVPRFAGLANWLSLLKILNSHLLVWIKKS